MADARLTIEVKAEGGSATASPRPSPTGSAAAEAGRKLSPERRPSGGESEAVKALVPSTRHDEARQGFSEAAKVFNREQSERGKVPERGKRQETLMSSLGSVVSGLASRVGLPAAGGAIGAAAGVAASPLALAGAVINKANKDTERFKDFSGVLARAVAGNQALQVQADLRSAEARGQSLANLQNLQGAFGRNFQNLGDAILPTANSAVAAGGFSILKGLEDLVGFGGASADPAQQQKTGEALYGALFGPLGEIVLQQAKQRQQEEQDRVAAATNNLLDWFVKEPMPTAAMFEDEGTDVGDTVDFPLAELFQGP